MRAATFGFVTAVVLAIAYAALDDITTNPEPSYAAEYTWLALTVVWLIVAGRVVRERVRRPRESTHRSDV